MLDSKFYLLLLPSKIFSKLLHFQFIFIVNDRIISKWVAFSGHIVNFLNGPDFKAVTRTVILESLQSCSILKHVLKCHMIVIHDHSSKHIKASSGRNKMWHILTKINNDTVLFENVDHTCDWMRKFHWILRCLSLGSSVSFVCCEKSI